MAFVTKTDTGVKTVIKGFLTGGTQASLTYPLDFLKTQLQLQSKTSPEFSGMAECAKKTVQKHGVRALYTGAGARIVGAGFQQMFRWGTYTNLVNLARDEKTGKVTTTMTIACGMGAGFTEAVFAVIPVETTKTRVGDDLRRGTGNYTGSGDAVLKILKSEGPLGLYRGAIATVLKQMTNQGVRMPLQVHVFTMITLGDESKKQSPIYNGIAGSCAGIGSVFLTQPQDCVKSRLQGEVAKELYTGTMDCVMKMARNEGPTAFFAGAVPRMVLLGAQSGVGFMLFPIISQLLNQVM